MADIKVEVVSWNQHRETLRSLRGKVFIEEQGVPQEIEWDDADATATHFLLTENTVALACGRLLPDGKVGRMAVLKEHRGRGLGQEMGCARGVDRALDRVPRLWGGAVVARGPAEVRRRTAEQAEDLVIVDGIKAAADALEGDPEEEAVEEQSQQERHSDNQVVSRRHAQRVAKYLRLRREDVNEAEAFLAHDQNADLSANPGLSATDTNSCSLSTITTATAGSTNVSRSTTAEEVHTSSTQTTTSHQPLCC